MSLTAIILAGGKSSRMGQDKAFIPWNGKRFIEHSIAAADSVASRVVLSGDKQRLTFLGLKVIEDVETDQGPVYALASCFSQIADKKVLVLSCDVPQVSSEDLQVLIKKHDTCADVTCFEYKNKVMPLIGIYNRSAFEAFKYAMKNKERKLFSVLNHLKVKTLEYKGEGGLMNINTPEDVKALI